MTLFTGYLDQAAQKNGSTHHRALGIFLRWGPQGVLLLMSEVPLYPHSEERMSTESLFRFYQLFDH